ncbi:unnamed protein product [Symbiodinium sp. CCMP2592]|nr:unnamed protein product [Symbiodinium sp. CCMP2592]
MTQSCRVQTRVNVFWASSATACRSDDWAGSRQEALALNAREAQLLLQKLRSTEAALHDERQLSGREREVIVERLRFAESQDEAARERLARALSSLRTRAREGAAEAAAQHGHTEDCLVRLKEENAKLQASQASCQAQLQELREELAKSHRSKQEAVEDKSKLLEALTQLRSERAEAKQLRVQQEGAQLVQVTADRDRLAGDAKRLRLECETRQREVRLLEANLESQRRAARYLEAESEKEVRMLRHEMSECSASDLQRAEADAKEKDRLTKALAEAMERQQAPSNLLHELKRWNGATLLLGWFDMEQTLQDWDGARDELRKEMRSWQGQDLQLQARTLEASACGSSKGAKVSTGQGSGGCCSCEAIDIGPSAENVGPVLSHAPGSEWRWDTRDAASSLWARPTPLANRQASMELEKTTVSLEAEMNAAFAQADRVKGASEQSLALSLCRHVMPCQAQAAKAAEESALAALSDASLASLRRSKGFALLRLLCCSEESERRCQTGLRRMDAMLADTKELTRELAKHKHLAKGMDDLVRRHERMLRQRDQDPLQATPTFSEVRSRSGRRPSPQARQPTVPTRSVQEVDQTTSGRSELRRSAQLADLHRAGGADSRKAAALSLNSPPDAGRLRSGSLSPRDRSKTQELRGSPYWRLQAPPPRRTHTGPSQQRRPAGRSLLRTSGVLLAGGRRGCDMLRPACDLRSLCEASRTEDRLSSGSSGFRESLIRSEEFRALEGRLRA